jgi:hypothetical protein
MPFAPSGRFPYERALAVASAVLLVFALLFIAFDLPIRYGADKAASRRPAITLSNTLSAVPVKKMPDGTEIYDVTCNVATGDQPHPGCITYTRPSTSAASSGR